MNQFFSDILEIDFYCQNKTSSIVDKLQSDKDIKTDHTRLYVTYNGTLNEEKNITYPSREYLNFLFSKFNLTEAIENKSDNVTDSGAVQRIQSFIQKSSKSKMMKKNTKSFLEIDSTTYLVDNNDEKKYTLEMIQMKLDGSSIHNLNGISNFVLAEQSSNRLTRFIWAMLIVVFSSIACFLCVKGSIDWATASQTELNKMKDAQLRAICDEINSKFAYVRNE